MQTITLSTIIRNTNEVRKTIAEHDDKKLIWNPVPGCNARYILVVDTLPKVEKVKSLNDKIGTSDIIFIQDEDITGRKYCKVFFDNIHEAIDWYNQI